MTVQTPVNRVFNAFLLTACLVQAQAAEHVIARSTGDFRLNGALVRGSATVLPGTDVSTDRHSTQLDAGTVGLKLAPGSQAHYGNRSLRLDRGSAQFAGGDGSPLEAKGLQIRTTSPTSVANVQLDPMGAVVVIAVNGPVSVFNQIGLTVANLDAGMARSLTPSSAQADLSMISGCLIKQNDRYFLKDTVSNVTSELRGASGLEANVGKQVQVSGTLFRGATPATGATQVIRVGELTKIADACADSPARGVSPAKTGPKASTRQGMSNGVKVGIVAAVGGGGAAAAALALGGKGDSRSR